MKNPVLLYLLSMLPGLLIAQSKMIYCNDFQNTVVISPEPIVQAVTGSDHFVFTYDKTKPDILGLLQGNPGHQSNLILRTSGGNIYIYTLKYSDSLSDYSFQIKREDRIRLSDSIVTDSKPFSKKIIEVRDRKETYYQKLSAYFASKTKKRLAVKRKAGMRIEVLAVHHHRDEVFITYRIKNRSRISFEIGDLALFRVQGKKARRSSFQKIRLEPVYKEEVPKAVAVGEERKFSVVYSKFSLGEHQGLHVELNEARGSRFFKLFF
ncbi:protein of unknown function [Salegentibacter agarivorans]|uniref:Bacteroides conjugative transposon TraN protein n=1 Tax=Salegentibacter agarivorans TaxID=345907 RepID=A0A1I2KNS0_9FLAO|nr:DUF4138 domain-containing protein [Salegentibacter agarivorans]SFF68634.1 protein of unknown function [Salegentibacter agarivorans]